MFILDTDHLAILRWRSQPSFERLEGRLEEVSSDQVVTTIVSLQEQMQGWLSHLNAARRSEEVLLAYDELMAMHEAFTALEILPFDVDAEKLFVELRGSLRRLGTLDLRIASIALARDAVLLSRNLRDFRQVPNLKVEDWTL